MEYWALLEGTGEGCDYTIDCNKTYEHLPSKNKESALKRCYDLFDEHDGFEGEPGIKNITLLEVNESTKIDLEKYDRERKEKEKLKEEEEERKRQEENDKKEYQRLKKKFEEN